LGTAHYPNPIKSIPLAIALESTPIETASIDQDQSILSQELKAQVLSLPPDDRLTLIAVIVESLKTVDCAFKAM
jgi:hypothetical protein